jgi:hypothetical protein
MTDIDDLRAELAERDRRLEEQLATLQRAQRGGPLPAAETLRRGYAASEAEREAERGGEAA